MDATAMAHSTEAVAHSHSTAAMAHSHSASAMTAKPHRYDLAAFRRQLAAGAGRKSAGERNLACRQKACGGHSLPVRDFNM